jgi:hypothetical protein
MTAGIIFIAIGEKWHQETIVAATTAKQFMPDIPITVFADRFFSAPAIDEVRVVAPGSNPLLTKTLWMWQSPYERTLFLDTDITLCEKIDDIFMLLDRFDLAVPHAPYRLASMGLSIPIPEFLNAAVPACFPGMNTGMLLFKRTPKVQAFFDIWCDYHQQTESLMPKAPSQPAFRAALYHSDLRFAIIPEEYHCRFIYPFKICGKVKVLHGRHPDMESVINRINQVPLPRVGEGYFVDLSRKHDLKQVPNQEDAIKSGLFSGLRKWLRSFGTNSDQHAPIPSLPPACIQNGGIITLS